jgi:branched-chain amino acid transport system permease protein
MKRKRAGLTLSASLFWLLALGAVMLPVVSNDVLWLDLGVRTFYYLLLVIGWNLLAGFTGQFSFGHVGLAAIGGYCSALAVQHFSLPIPVGMIVGMLAAGLAGCLLGVVSIRIRGVYLVMTTFALMRVVQIVLYAEQETTGGASGLVVPTLFKISEVKQFYLLGLGLTGLLLLSQWLLLRSRAGGYLAAIRLDEEAARAIGINSRFWKIAIFSYSSAWAGVAGAFTAHYAGFLSPGLGSVTEMSLVLAMGTIGGLGSIVGPLVSTVSLQVLSDQLQSAGGLSALLFGIVMLVVVVGFPEGIGGLVRRIDLRLKKRKNEHPEAAT